MPPKTDETVFPPLLRTGEEISAIALVGFMGAGKSTVGHALAFRLGWRFEDLDHSIENCTGRMIQEIFANDGESKFRDLEYSLLRKAVQEVHRERLVLALGGGAFAEARTRHFLQTQLIPAVFLDAPVEELFRRCEQPEVVRPLRRDFEQFRQLYEQRRSSYLEAAFRVTTEGKEVNTVVAEIVAGLKLAPVSGVSG